MKAGLQRGIDRMRRARESRGIWPSAHRAALSFSFDDARPSQLDAAVPLFDRLGLAATFFVLPEKVAADRARWRDAVATGHEIGNHTVHHPCSGNFAWSRDRALEELTLTDFHHELDDADRQLHELLGVVPRVFAYPCGQTFVGRGRDTKSVVPMVAERFVAGRTFNNVSANSPLHCDLAQVAAVNIDELTFSQVQPRLEAALAAGAWLVLGGHEVGEQAGPETTAVATVEAVVAWCRDHDVWIDTIGAIAARVTKVAVRA
jgi:peptidoglycan/xylan/chitin deacetylase (PgdA/CDA1 family)